MDEMILCCSQMIAKSGVAKSMFMESIKEARKSHIDNALELMKKGNDNLIEGHRIHSQLIQKEAQKEKIDINLLLIHAEDQMNSAEIIQSLSEEFIMLYKEKYLKEI